MQENEQELMQQAVETEKEDVIPDSVDTLADIFMDMLGEDRQDSSEEEPEYEKDDALIDIIGQAAAAEISNEAVGDGEAKVSVGEIFSKLTASFEEKRAEKKRLSRQKMIEQREEMRKEMQEREEREREMAAENARIAAAQAEKEYAFQLVQEQAQQVADHKAKLADMAMQKIPGGDCTVIAPGTVITGNLVSTEDVIVKGAVSADIKCEGDVCVIGKVNGNIAAANVVLSEGTVNGNVSSLGHVCLTEGSVLVGDMVGTSCDFGGNIRGNIAVAEGITIHRHSVVLGNVDASSISVEEGSLIKGIINVVADDDSSKLSF